MREWLLWLVTAAYFWTALEYAFKREGWSALVWFGYAIANVGLIKTFERVSG